MQQGTNKAKQAPPLPDNAPGRNKFHYKQQYGVIIICQDEADHRQTYERVTALGYKCKAVRV
jgi:hypothetical protein